MSEPGAPSTIALGVAVAQRRREIGYSQNDLAARCAIHRAYIGGIEQGRRNPTWRVLATIAAGLDLRLSELAARAEAVQAELAASGDPEGGR
jgi:transcriptional regulator with XRE-family HTH domain